MKYPTHDATALLFEGKFTDGNPIAAVPPSPDRADYQNAVYDELLAVIVAGGLTPDFANRAQVQAAIAAQILAGLNGINQQYVPVRQTVSTGPVDSSGKPDFLEAGSGLSVALKSSVTTSPLILTSGGGFSLLGGQINYGRSINTVQTWAGLAANETHFLYITWDADGAVTLLHNTLPPVYASAAPASPAEGQWFYPIDHRHGAQVWDGSAWQAVRGVCIGEAVTGASSVADVVCYAYQGKAMWEDTNSSSGHNVSVEFQDNLGVPGRWKTCEASIRLASAFGNFPENSYFQLPGNSDRDSGSGITSHNAGVGILSRNAVKYDRNGTTAQGWPTGYVCFQVARAF